jgi:hypothetical protein
MTDGDSNKGKKGAQKAEVTVRQIETRPAPEIKPLPGTKVTYDLAKAVKKKDEK